MKRITLVICMLSSGLVAAGEPVTVQRPVPYAANSTVAGNVKNECKVPEQLADFLQQYSDKKGTKVNFTDSAVDTSKGRVLKLEILDAVSMGGAWMGHAKSTAVRGELFENGKRVAGFTGRRNSMGGMYAGFKSSCSVLGRTAKALGNDIAGWLDNPTDNATLGDL